MELRNARGHPVDPVPFLVVTGLVFTVCYSFGPIYFAEYGWDLRGAVGLSTGVFLASTAAAYYRMVWTSRPDLRAEIPAALRLRRLFLGVLAGFVVLVGLTLPLLVE